MCGICGVVRPAGLPPEAATQVRRMAAALSHRGPDDEGFFHDRHAALGSRRLSIVDLGGGHQPIGSEDGSVQLVYNGEIYNFREERARLEAAGHRFRTATDSEVVVHAYEEEGASGLSRLNGIFALALWDAPRRRLLLARDPLGVKPLYYAWDGSRLAFASEIKALLEIPGMRREVDAEALERFLAFRFVPSPRTLFRGVAKIAPGQWLVLEGDGPPRFGSYAPPPELPDPRPSAAEWEEALAAEIPRAVRRQLMGDVPMGILLSGGADSAAMLAFAAAASGTPVHAFTVGFEETFALDEAAAAATTARLLGAPHRQVRLAGSGYGARLLRAIRALDEPVGTPSIAPYDALCELAASERKVVLSGQGADEPFGGYRRHLGEKITGGRLGSLLAGPAALAASLRPGDEPLERAARAAGVRDPVRRYIETLALFPAAERSRILGRRSGDPEAIPELEAIAARASHLDPLARFLYVDARFGLADDLLLYADKVGMAHSLEVRVPFLDLELLRLVERIPATLRVTAFPPKRLLKRALAAAIPAEVRARPKINFAPPDDAWIAPRGGGPCIDWLIEPNAAVSSYLVPHEVGRLVDEQRRGTRDRRRQLFSLLAFEIWHRSFIERRGDAE